MKMKKEEKNVRKWKKECCERAHKKVSDGGVLIEKWVWKVED